MPLLQLELYQVQKTIAVSNIITTKERKQRAGSTTMSNRGKIFTDVQLGQDNDVPNKTTTAKLFLVSISISVRDLVNICSAWAGRAKLKLLTMEHQP